VVNSSFENQKVIAPRDTYQFFALCTYTFLGKKDTGKKAVV